MAKIHRIGFSEISAGEGTSDDSKCQPRANIIFIHGLRGHPRETWEAPASLGQGDDIREASREPRGLRSFFGTETQRDVLRDDASPNTHVTGSMSDQKIFWIKDFLPHDIRDARILTYGYDADVIDGLFQTNNQNSIWRHGQDLKAKLERDLDDQTPIVFVAHSLGGIIVKDALHWSKSTRQRTKLIVFLGTPHRGSLSAGWGKIASNIVRLVFQDSNKKILETLEVNSEVLDRIHEDFKTIVFEDGIKVHSFQEARGIAGIKGLHNKVVDDFSSKVDLASEQETVETIDANHMQMTKYCSKDDSGYMMVLGVLKRFIARLNAPGAASTEIISTSSNVIHHSIPASLAPRVHFMVKPQRNGDLVGREMYIKTLEAKLCVGNEHCRVALVGLGGVGKSRIALEYAFKYEKSDSTSVFWVHAGTAERMEKAYQEIAEEAGLAGAVDPTIDKLRLVKSWLEREDSGYWIMIIDNVDDEGLFFNNSEGHGDAPSTSLKNLAQYFPRRSNGSILLTTRNKKVGVNFAKHPCVINIPAMSVSESRSLLVENLEENTWKEHEDNLAVLAEVLENLPLALVQAAAFIRKNSLSIGSYLELYRKNDSAKIDLLSQNFEDTERHPDSKNPVAATWAISFEHIRRTDRLAADMLSLMSVVDRQAIPKPLLSSDNEPVECETALGTLKGFSLITSEKSGQAFNLHRLVYLATRNWLSINKELGHWTVKALELLLELFPDVVWPDSFDDDTREKWMTYLQHAQRVLSSDQLPDSGTIAQANLLHKVSRCLVAKGDHDSANIAAQKAVDLRVNLLGENHPDTINSARWLAVLDQDTELLGRVLNFYKRELGETHPTSLLSSSYLAFILTKQGQYETAEPMLRLALNRCEEELGEDHLVTLETLKNLAESLYLQGQLEEAEKMFRRAQNILETKWVKDHPSTFIHPDTLTSVFHFALTLHKLGKYQSALPIYQRATAGLEKALGSDHPLTLECSKSYAQFLNDVRKAETQDRTVAEDDP